MNTEKNRIEGLIAGLILGDALGAKYEGGLAEKIYWSIVGKTRDGRYRYTDDTEMSVALMEVLIESKDVDQEALAKHFAASVTRHRGYGLGTKETLSLIRKGVHWSQASRKQYPEGSIGNGAAMRAPVLAVAFRDESHAKLLTQVELTSEVTHGHADAVECAKLIACTCRHALLGVPNEEILVLLSRQSQCYAPRIEQIEMLIREKCEITDDRIRHVLGNGVIANESVFTSIWYALVYRDSELATMLSAIARLGGDVDTIGSMAGAIWGAFNGINKIPAELLSKVERSEEIIEMVSKL